ncbi:odorant receptor 49b-like [Aricia agestis]|uniref:odorant receptor 49b-like n=1 Tax=Aricia agestis TaxID=91739 RepID=UPI001C205A21|nr:odorant receptor 49b-like [Aricia agestis]
MFTEGELFQFNLDVLFYVGLWPNDGWTGQKLVLYRAFEYFIHGLAFTFIVITSIGSYMVQNDLPVFMSNLDKTCVAYNFVVKVFFFLRSRERLKGLIKEIQGSGDRVTEDRKKQMAYSLLVIIVLATALTSVFCGISLLKGEMTVVAWVPFDVNKSFMNLFLSVQILSGTFVVPCLYRGLAMQGVICSIVMYFCDQLDDVQCRLRGLMYSERASHEIKEDIKWIIQKHVRIIRYANTLKGITKEFFLIQNLAMTFELCLNAIMVTLMGSENKTMLASFLAFLSLALINAYIFCYIGNELITKSIGVANAAYETSWLQWPVPMQKYVLTILTVAQRPLALTAGGMKIMCMQTFGHALYNAYSLFTLLNDMID